jgi:hypothetical protein
MKEPVGLHQPFYGNNTTKDFIIKDKLIKDSISYGPVSVKISEEKLEVFFEYNPNSCGMPSRVMYDSNSDKKVFLKQKAFILNPEEYGKIIFNGRFTDADTGNWWYEKHIFNLIYTSTPSEKMFLNMPVSKKYEQLAKLW